MSIINQQLYNDDEALILSIIEAIKENKYKNLNSFMTKYEPQLKQFESDNNKLKIPEEALKTRQEQHTIFNLIEFLNGCNKYLLNEQFDLATQMLTQPKAFIDYEAFNYEQVDSMEFNSFDNDFSENEMIGLKHMKDACFVLNCHNLFEYDTFNKSVMQLKPISLKPKTLLEHYIEQILEFQDRTQTINNDNSIILPIYIIAYEQIQDQLIHLLNFYELFGTQSNQIRVQKTFRIPQFMGSNTNFQFNEKFNFTKPGSGWMHYTLKWNESKQYDRFLKGKQWVLFLEDNNLLQFKVLSHMLGLAVSRNLDVVCQSVHRQGNEPFKMLLQDKDHKNPYEFKKYKMAQYWNQDLKGSVTYQRVQHTVKLEDEFRKTHESLGKDELRDKSEENKQNVDRESNNLRSKLLLELYTLSELMVMNTKAYHTALYHSTGLPYFNSLQLTQFSFDQHLDPKEEENYQRQNLKEDLKKMNFVDYSKKRDANRKVWNEFNFTDQEWNPSLNFHDILFNLDPQSNVLNVIQPRWLCSAPIRSDLAQAKTQVDLTLQAATLSTAETCIYQCNYQILKELKVKLPQINDIMFVQEVPHLKSPLIYLGPKFACSIEEIRQKLHTNLQKIMIDSPSTLQLSGNVEIFELSLNGGLMLEAPKKGRIVISRLNCKNNGPVIQILPQSFLKHDLVDLNVKIKGYKLKLNQLFNQSIEKGQIQLEDELVLQATPHQEDNPNKIKKDNNYNYL